MSLFSTSPRIPQPKVDTDCGSLSVFSTFVPPPGFQKREPHLDLLVSPRTRKQLRSSASSSARSTRSTVATKSMDPSTFPSNSRVSSARSTASTTITARSAVAPTVASDDCASSASPSRYSAVGCKLGRESIGGTPTTCVLPSHTVSEGLMAGIANRRKFTKMRTQLSAFDRSFYPPSNSSTTGCSVVSDFSPSPRSVDGKKEIGSSAFPNSTKGSLAMAARPSPVRSSVDLEGPAAYNPRDEEGKRRENRRGEGTAAFRSTKKVKPRVYLPGSDLSNDESEDHQAAVETSRCGFLNAGGACHAHAYQPLVDWNINPSHHREVNKYVPPPRPPKRAKKKATAAHAEEADDTTSPKKSVSFKRQNIFVY